MGIIRDMFYISNGISNAATNASLRTQNNIYTLIQNARTKKEIKQVYQHASQANFQNRMVMSMPGMNKQQLLLLTSAEPNENDVYDYDTSSQTPGVDFIWGSAKYPEGEVVSGGDEADRVAALMPFVHKSQQEGLPMIALYSGSKDLATMISAHCVAAEFITRGQV